MHFAIAADVQAGKNVFGGVELSFYFTEKIGLLAGPVYFFHPGSQPGGNRWMWSV